MLSLLFVGCGETVDSNNIRTDGIWADYEVVSTDENAEIIAELKTGGPNSNTTLELKSGDKLVAHLDESKANLKKRDTELLEDRSAFGTTLQKSLSDADVRISFERDLGENALNSKVNVPKTFQIQAPNDDISFSRSDDDILVQIGEADEEATTEAVIKGSCLKQDYTRTFDGGKTTEFTSGSLQATSSEQGESGPSSEVTLEIQRTAEGSVDPTLGGGEFTATQKRSLTFESVP